ncbi:HNH endonuclease signature motif containing protein [Microbacterium hydrocarbonoxydans]|uniref:HNH endonuclease signature motif containing protein n=1 Tax=Microbacterium hydrocarbonoxydans TaxID=273678 RepID=UPI00203F7F8D|nr:HNH endonuclease signature motif containing protein [Microbacterium hydrocarbonoxydans]MCM3781086.1 HNH endonuclease [Microbacterium hydrocarbonoxydans]
MITPTDLDLDLRERQRLLDGWVQKRRQIAELEAEATELLIERIGVHEADVAESPFHRDAIYRSMLSEYSAAAHLPHGTVEHSFTDARTLSRDLPATRAAFRAGDITVGHVREIVRASAVVAEAVRNGRVDAETLTLYETAVLVIAEKETAARTRAHARQVAAALAGETVVERHRRAESERCVSVRSVDDGLALLTAVLPEWLAVAIADRLTRMAREVVRGRADAAPTLPPVEDRGDEITVDDLAPDDPRRDSSAAGTVIFGEDGTFTVDPLAGLVDPLTDPSSPDIEHLPADGRTLDQIRADLFADLLLVSVPSAELGSGLDAVQPRIQVTVAASTLIGADDRPAELDGHGPLDPGIARALAGRNTGWSRLFLDPAGQVVQTDTYTPTEAMRRHLRARDQHCRFPGCRMPVHRCEIDHNHDHALGGRTRLDNLSHFCTTHHSLKHPDVDPRHRWTARQLPDGCVTWESPLGRSYVDPPRRRVMFV